jgi:hypothetical protein
MTGQLGSSEWSAPEMLLGDDYAHKVDSYSYAVILYAFLSPKQNTHTKKKKSNINHYRWELFTGQVPYGSLGLSSIQIGMRVLTKGLRPSPLPSTESCPALILELIQKCWDLDPNKRLEFDVILEILNAVIIGNSFPVFKFSLRLILSTDPSPVVSHVNTYPDKVKPGKGTFPLPSL